MVRANAATREVTARYTQDECTLEVGICGRAVGSGGRWRRAEAGAKAGGGWSWWWRRARGWWWWWWRSIARALDIVRARGGATVALFSQGRGSRGVGSRLAQGLLRTPRVTSPHSWNASPAHHRACVCGASTGACSAFTRPPPSLPFERQRSQKVVLALDPAHLLRNVKVECTQRLGIKEVRPSSPCRARRAGRCRDARGVANTRRAPILAVPRARRAVL